MKAMFVPIVAVASFLIGCSDGHPSPSQSDLEPAAAVEKSPSESPEVRTGWTPSDACSFLNPVLVTGGYKHDFDGEYHCSSPYKELGASPRGLPNNLAYYVTGTSSVADETKLVLNYNQPANARAATDQLVSASKTLAIKATGNDIPPNILAAITAGRPTVETVGQFKHEVERDDWPTGRGYEMRYVVTKATERR